MRLELSRAWSRAFGSVSSQAAESIGLARGCAVNVSQPSTLRMLNCPEASKAQNNMAGVSADGSTVRVLIRRLALVVRALFH
jgi:hypothetical protein